MKTTAKPFLHFLAENNKIDVPIYQRTYAWDLEHCLQLWEDILYLADHLDQQSYFLGTILCTNSGSNVNLSQEASPPSLAIIDGQQRTITLSLLLAAVANALGDELEDNKLLRQNIYANYLIASSAEEGRCCRLILSRKDQDIFIKILDNPKQIFPLQKRVDHLIENYLFFSHKIRQSGIDLCTLYECLKKLTIVEVLLDENQDVLELFKRINTTGVPLTQAEVIRAEVLQGLDPEEREDFYDSYWFPLEQTLSLEEDPDLFYQFMREYLKQHSGKKPAKKDIVASFRAYYRSHSEMQTKKIVEDMLDKSFFFSKAAAFYTQNPETRDVLKNIEVLQVQRALIFSAEVYRDHLNERFTYTTFINILKLIESYILRSFICGAKPSKLEKIFAGLSTSIDKSNYLPSLIKFLISQDSPAQWSDTAIFRNIFITKDIYNLPEHLRSYLFRKLECYDRKEHIIFGDYSVEHIMPQNPKLSLEWQKELGSDWKNIQSKYLHTIGNLTLTGYNSELSDRSFSMKRDMKGGFADSPLRLNRTLARLPNWSKEEIEKRASDLADLAVQIWAIPSEELGTPDKKPHE